VSAADAVNATAPKQFVLSTRQAAHWINDRQWAERTVTDVETVGVNTTELWEFVNRSPMPHPMHLHGSPFRVVARSWEDDSLAATWAGLEAGVIETGLRDTVMVWPGQRVRLAVRFAEHEGYFLYHCHVLEHEDAGMMRSYRAVRR
jgi:FtsP/CotA-like multicopper oxidase with cupredoxin domain